jgi:protein-L-isoaspartate(D-aspartate) O-methyltransferase
MDTDPYAELRASMVLNQIERRGIIDEKILTAMHEIPRHLFVPKEYWGDAYADHPLPIGGGQTISQPYIVAFMTNVLDLKEDDNVLEIGTGSGYQAAVLSRLVKKVHTIERISELAERAHQTFVEMGLLNIEVHVADGSLGWIEKAPYQAILVTAAAPQAPKALLDQLDESGRMVIPVGSRFHQELELWRKQKTKLHRQEVLPVVFVPLYGEHGWDAKDW